MSKQQSKKIDFLSPVSTIPGFGEKRLQALQENSIKTIGDLLYYFPHRYTDFRTIVPLQNIAPYTGKHCVVKGTIIKAIFEKGKKSRFRIQLDDGTGTIEAIWFHTLTYLSKTLTKGKEITLSGQVSYYHNYQMSHPEIHNSSVNEIILPYLPQYRISQSMKEARIPQKALVKAVQWVFQNLTQYPRVLPQSIEDKYCYPPLKECLQEIHFPQTMNNRTVYFTRIKHEELYLVAIAQFWMKKKFAQKGHPFRIGDLLKQFLEILPFELTDSQKSAIKQLYQHTKIDKRMHALLQGDVGSGKTITAFIASLPALNEGYQVVWLTPTEVLADQTYKVIHQWCQHLNISTGLLKSNLSSSEKRETLNKISNGEISYIIGTHAIIQPSVRFSKAGMLIIDEQHKFGVEQRELLQKKAPTSDLLLLSATPIPQTLGQTLYNDIDIVTIQQAPSGRKEISTHIIPPHKRIDMENFILKEIKENNSQVFIVAPRIEDLPDTTIKSTEEIYRDLKKSSLYKTKIGLLHGKLSSEEKELLMNQFNNHKIDILVATTVIEVGVDNPNATIMVIEDAHCFGLAQLHQLRGRVGRGDKQSYAFLMTDINTEETLNRLKRFTQTTDGFEIAELDLQTRGPGQINGYRQTGWGELRFADIISDAPLFKEILHDISSLSLE